MFKSPISTFLLVALGFCSVVGCGPSKEDLIMRAARRSRPKAEGEKEQPPTEVNTQTAIAKPPSARAPVAPPSARMQPVAADTTGDPAESESDASMGADAPTDDNEVTLIADRKPEKPLSPELRRAQAFHSISSIADGMRKYMAEHDRLISPAIYSKSKVATLSWRVKLLPYLGYQSLYEKFDPEVPWYMEPNLSLLQYIPDEFVSPERFDTKTNFQIPVSDACLFGPRVRGLFNKVEDGLENTLMLVEVNDSHAVEWTAPEDYNPPDMMNTARDFGSLRADGTFAVWGNGWVTALPSNASNQQLKNAFSAEAGDRSMVGVLHRRIKIENLSDGSVTPTEESAPEMVPVDQPDQIVDTTPLVPDNTELLAARDPVPSVAEMRESSERLRTVYAKEISAAKLDKDKVGLARKLLGVAASITEHPADAMTILNAVSKIAIDAGSADLTIEALDQRVGRFELDPYEENIQALAKFAEGTARRNRDSVGEIDSFLNRSVIVISVAIRENDFMRASNLARTCAKWTADEDEDDLRKLFTRLRGQLGGAKNAFDDAREYLVIYRENPDELEAGARFGQFLCFIKGEWQTGLKLLIDGSNRELAELAKADLEDASTVDDQVALGDAWWQMSRKAGGVYRQGAQDRAVHWYNQAYPLIPESLERKHVKNQLQEASSDTASSPVAVCRQLAEALNVDLRVSLASIGTATFQGKAGPSGVDVDRD